MQAKLSEQEKTLIAHAVTEAESRTTGEIVTVLARQSDHYSAAALVIALALTGIFSFIVHLTHPEYLFNAMSIIELGVFFLLLTIFELSGAHIFLVPRAHKVKAVRRLLQEQFLTSKLHMTKDRAAILILISQRERLVEVMADTGIASRAPPESWETITRQLSHNLRTHSLADAVQTAVVESGALLAKYFPSDGSRKNELPNEVQFL